MPAKTPEGFIRRTAKQCLQTYVSEGEKTPAIGLNWIVGELDFWGVHGQVLLEIFDELQDYPKDADERKRFQKVREYCQNAKWF